MTPAAVFYYDLGSPECYLAAERTMTELPAVPEWEPVLASDVCRDDASLAPAPEWDALSAGVDREALAARVASAGLQPLRWPVGWPPDARRALLAATYAKTIGRGVAFSLAAFRQAFAGGRDLADDRTILIAGAACEMHPAALLRALETRSVRDSLVAACQRARDAGVRELPAIAVGRRVLSGPDVVAQAAAALR